MSLVDEIKSAESELVILKDYLTEAVMTLEENLEDEMAMEMVEELSDKVEKQGSSLDALKMSEHYIKAMDDHARSELERSAKLIEQFTQTAASREVALDSDSFSYVQTIGVVATAPGLARKLLKIAPSERDGLFACDEIAELLHPDCFQEGYFVGKDYMLMAHPCYRRRMDPMDNWAPEFIRLFCRLDSSKIKKFIAIDEDRVKIDIDSYSKITKDIWYGAPFNQDISKLENCPIKLRPPLDLDPPCIDWFFAQSYCLDIKWSEANQIKTFQALEIKTEDSQIVVDNQIYFPARYLHAEFDLSTGIFRHFDGAIQYFTKDEYFRRRDSDFNIIFKSNEHIKARAMKVFKLNGSLTVETWVELCCHFFSANPLIIEYFTGKYPEPVNDILAKVRALSY